MRAFVAVDVASSGIGRVQHELMASAGWNPRDVKPVGAQNFHFTLIFLGEIGEIEAGRIKEKLSGLQFAPFTLTYTGVGAFPTPNFAKVIWVGVDPLGGQRLTVLADQVIAKMSDLGFRPDKPFSPHLTIFRIKNRPVMVGDVTARYAGRTFGSDLIDRVHLKKSELHPSGPVYSNIYTVEANTVSRI